RLPGVGLPHEGDVGFVEGGHDGGGGVGRAVVDDDDFEFGIVAAQERPDGGGDAHLLVEGGYDDADGGQEAVGPSHADGAHVAAGQENDRQAAGDGQQADHDEESGEGPGEGRGQPQGEDEAEPLEPV